MTEINRRYFDGLMDQKKLSLRGLTKEMGMGHSQLSLAFNGTRKLQLDEAAKLSRIFGEPLHRIVENAGVTVRPISGRRVPVLGALHGDGTVQLHEAKVVERASAPEDLPDNVSAIQCRTVGTVLDWLDGWVFFFRNHDGIDPTVLGRLCFCKIANGPCVIANVKRGYQDGTYNLSGPYVRESAALEWATPIIVTRN